MGALTNNRKRVDECFSLCSPSPSFSCHKDCDYSDRIDTRVLKKPRVSSAVIGSSERVDLLLASSVSRLNRYPEPDQGLHREVHAPCRVLRFGLPRLSGGFRSRASQCSEREDKMGNTMGSSILRKKYELAKKRAFSVLYHVKPEPEKEEDLVLEDSSDVEIIEDGNERSVVSNDRRERKCDGLALLLETQKSDGMVLEGPSSAVEHRERKRDGLALLLETQKSDGMVLEGPSSAVEHRGKMWDSWSPDQRVYKRMFGSIQRTYSNKLGDLNFSINLEEAKLLSLRTERSVRKVEEAKKPEDSFHQPFTPLTAEEEKEVRRAFSNLNRRKVLVNHENSNILITGEILQCLRPGAWLNDEVINVYMELLKERERRTPKKFLNCHFFNTFFYKKLIVGRNSYDYRSVRRWTTQKKLGYGLADCDKIFVPIHKEVHWCLAVINKKDKKFQYLDSLGGIDSHCLKVLARYFVDEVKDKSGQDLDISSWENEFVKDLPEQQNGFDCGVFMIKYADFYSRGMGLQFSQENMPYFRLRTAKEILRLRAE